MTAPDDIQSRYAQIRDDFELLGDWEERYRHVIELGRALPELSPADRNEATRVRGCSSQVWLAPDVQGDRIFFRGDSDALIVKGLVALLITLLSGARRAEILNFDLGEALRTLGLDQALSSQRANGLASMVRRIYDIAGAED